MTPNEPSGADIDPSGLYRFSLWRTFARVVIGTASHRLGFVMLNPSTADATTDDPTIRRCLDFAWRNRFDGIHV